MTHDFLKTLDAFDNATSSRRDAIRKAARLGGNAALAALPLFAAAKHTMAKSYGFNPQEDVDILNFALTLEYLEYFFYLRAVGSEPDADGNQDVPAELADIPSQGITDLLAVIRDHELAHVGVLSSTISDLDGTPVTYCQDDFTFDVDGANVYDDYDLFLTLAQGFEDTGVRAYKGQAAAIDAAAVLTAALQIHSVEARHAAAIRRLRMNQGWIPFSQPDAPMPIAATYAGEDNTTQGGVELVGALAGLGYTEEQITEAFDETLDMTAVLDIAGPFITGDPEADGDCSN